LFSVLGQTSERSLLRPIADGCPKLTVLKWRVRNTPTDEICYFLQRKKHQLVTYEHDGQLTASIFTAINECTNLKSLSFFGNIISDPTVLSEASPNTKLQNLKALEISLYGLPTVSNITLSIFVHTLSHLSYIGLCCIGGYIDDLTNTVILKCPLLTHLNLEENALHDTGLRNIHSCKMLKYINVSDCRRLDRRAMAYVAEGCPQLQHLNVSHNPVSEGMFQEILRCRNLKTLLMKNCNLKYINLRLISTHINGLLYLLVGNGFELRDEVRNQLKQEMPRLDIKKFTHLSEESEYLRMKNDPLPKYFC
jgi:hypothetical protein